MLTLTIFTGLCEEFTVYKFLIVIEKAGKNYSAYSPDLPGCIATRKLRLLDLRV